ncbi:hypothetical protein, partial [Acidocella sp.]|uniref:hypothetical protein n=1 Tax=Acidocella sp. TaxID=50710 RepID=UPI002F3FA950
MIRACNRYFRPHNSPPDAKLPIRVSNRKFPALGIPQGESEARRAGIRSRFLKKAAQKLFLCWAMGVSPTQPLAQRSKVFLLLFVHKK